MLRKTSERIQIFSVKRIGFYPTFGPFGTKWIRNEKYEDFSGNLEIFIQMNTDEFLGCGVITFMERFYFENIKEDGVAKSIGLGNCFYV